MRGAQASAEGTALPEGLGVATPPRRRRRSGGSRRRGRRNRRRRCQGRGLKETPVPATEAGSPGPDAPRFSRPRPGPAEAEGRGPGAGGRGRPRTTGVLGAGGGCGAPGASKSIEKARDEASAL